MSLPAGMRQPNAQPFSAIDRHLGQRIRKRRLEQGLTVEQFSDLLSVSPQQAHKFESGVNRVSAGTLFVIARLLAADVKYFFEDLLPDPADVSRADGNHT